MKRLMALMFTAVAVAVPLAGSAQASVSAHAASGKTIVQIAASNKQFSTLVALVKEAGLVKALSGSTKLTVFAPTNAAFAKVPKATLKKLAHNKKLLTEVLEYHVVPGVVTAAQVEKLHSAKTLEGARVHFSVKHGHVYVNNAEVIAANIRASNGIIHVINRVLIP